MQVFRGSAVRAEKGYPGSIKLTLKILEGIDFKDVIYGERSQTGAMGNAGGIILYVLINKKMIRYETNVSKDSTTAEEALKQITLNEDLFDLFYGGMGNGVFVNKNATLGIDEDNNCFWYDDGKTKHRIDPSVEGVFLATAEMMKTGKPKGLYKLHQEWEQDLRNIFGKK